MLIRTGKAVTGEPEYGLTETGPGASVDAPGSRSGWEITTICAPEAPSHITSSAPFEEMRVRKNAGACPGATVPRAGKLSTIFQPLEGNDLAGTRGTGSLSSVARRMALNSSTV